MPNQYRKKYATEEEAKEAIRQSTINSRRRKEEALARGEIPDVTKPCEREGCDQVVRKGLRSQPAFDKMRYCSRSCSGLARVNTDAVRRQRVGRDADRRRKPSPRQAVRRPEGEPTEPQRPIWRPPGWSETPDV